MSDEILFLHSPLKERFTAVPKFRKRLASMKLQIRKSVNTGLLVHMKTVRVSSRMVPIKTIH